MHGFSILYLLILSLVGPNPWLWHLRQPWFQAPHLRGTWQSSCRPPARASRARWGTGRWAGTGAGRWRCCPPRAESCCRRTPGSCTPAPQYDCFQHSIDVKIVYHLYICIPHIIFTYMHIWCDNSQVRLWIIFYIHYNDFHHQGRPQICAGAGDYFGVSEPHSGKLWKLLWKEVENEGGGNNFLIHKASDKDFKYLLLKASLFLFDWCMFC